MNRLPPVLVRRLTRELDLLHTSPPPYVAAWPASADDIDENDTGRVSNENDAGENDEQRGTSRHRLDVLEAEIRGAPGTPYAGGRFRLSVHIPLRYPFEPPKVRFTTPIYHPNIDSGGRICLDTLNMPPKGSWKPSVNVPTVLATIQQLMGEPNADDGLMAEIAEQYRRDRRAFERTARDWTQRYAAPDCGSANGGAARVDTLGGDMDGARTASVLTTTDAKAGAGAGGGGGGGGGSSSGGGRECPAEDDARRARRKRLRLGGDSGGDSSTSASVSSSESPCR